jgi:hypothetical protein
MRQVASQGPASFERQLQMRKDPQEEGSMSISVFHRIAGLKLFLFIALSCFWIQPESWAQAAPTAPAPDVAPARDSKAGISASDAGPTAALPGQVKEATKEKDIPLRSDMFYEDWRKPELTPGMYSLVDPLDRMEGSNFTRELVHAQWRELDPIDLYIIRPAKVKNPPVIVYLYSYPSTTDRYKDDKFCEFLTRGGFAAIGFAPAMTEHRFHDRPTSEWFVSQLTESLGTSVHDVQLVLNYLATRGDFDMSRVGIWGDGAGATIAIMAASVDSRIQALDLLDPWGDWPNWLSKSTLVPDKEREKYLKPDFLKAVESFDPVKALPKMTAQRIRIQHIDGVTVTPAIVREHLEAAAPANASVVRYKSSKQFFEEVGSKGIGFDWIQQQAGPNIPLKAAGQTNSIEAQNSVAK